MADQSLEGHFDKKGMIIALPPTNMENIDETSIDHAIEVGAEEVSQQDEDKRLTFYCEMRQLHLVRSKLLELGYTIEDCNISFIPKFTVSLGDDEMELMSKIIGKLEEHPDVVVINDNIE